MSSYKDVFHRLRVQLQPLYDASEATAIARLVMEEMTGITYSQSLSRQEDQQGDEITHKIAAAAGELIQGKPLQYVLGYAWFMNRKFTVNEHTLIPRPETEELVQWIIDDCADQQGQLSIADIGTGTGCIPVSLRLSLQNTMITAFDISKEAIAVAGHNAKALDAAVHFKELDFLQQADTLNDRYDVIVSNPPYIPAAEKESMHINVRDFEPGTALFVPDEDPLLFYKAIALFGKTHLTVTGAVYCELHKDYALATEQLFIAAGYKKVVLRKDMNGHWRMLKATYNQ